MSIIKTENLVRHFTVGTQTVEALRGVSLDINKGEFVAIMGPSGSGKSTLMNIIGCLDSPTSGTYYLNNKNVSTLDDDALAMIRNHEIGFVFQNFHLLARNTALDNVMLPLKYAGIDKSEQEEIAMEVIKSVDLESRAHHQPSELSGGQQQRVAIARAIINDPQIILADEPTGSLDMNTAKDIFKLLNKQKRSDRIIIFATHNRFFAKKADYLLEMRDGSIKSSNA